MSNPEIKFMNNTQFSIRCGKCTDIHNAQLEGKTSCPCECDCHDKYTSPYVPYCPTSPPPVYFGERETICGTYRMNNKVIS